VFWGVHTFCVTPQTQWGSELARDEASSGNTRLKPKSSNTTIGSFCLTAT
jgi:hypothetical protein